MIGRPNAQRAYRRGAFPPPEPRVAVTLAQALLKSDKMDRVIRDAVMLGVTAIQPFVSRRTDVPLKAVTGGGRQDRWDRTVISSVKQCGRAVVPPVHATKEFSDIVKPAAERPADLLIRRSADFAELDREGSGHRRDGLLGPEGGLIRRDKRRAAAGVRVFVRSAASAACGFAAAALVPVLRYIWRDLWFRISACRPMERARPYYVVAPLARALERCTGRPTAV